MGRGLSDLQKRILASAYDVYRLNQRMTNWRKERPHITAQHVVYFMLGGDKLPKYRGNFGYDETFNPTGVLYNFNWFTDEQHRQYKTAYAVACKSLKRLEQRGFLERHEASSYKPGYRLTEQGLVIAAPFYEAVYSE